MGMAEDIYNGGGAKPVKFALMTTIEGRIVNIRSKQCEAYGTGRLETWPNGDAKMTPILTVQTTLQEEPDDDGLRDLYMRGGLYTALGAAMRAAFPKAPTDQELIGATIKVQHHDTAPSSYGTPRKLYRAKITPSASTTAAAWSAAAEEGGPEDEVPF
jgi:hypothetical protein